ncbi:alpha-crystallin A chain-like [Daphnia carinata]|uniref:alpha-crystallin A chain-like n=1 Tax=Daphnia carinata TaxID=120202 RepID=UPI00257D7B00|nr:alpha-crystallin A chain-like [Daphnia carinata]
MSLMPYSDFHTMMDPFEPYDTFDPYSQLQTFDPYAFGSNIMPRSMRRAMRRMDHELGKLLSSVKEDDKSFQITVDVSHFDPSEITVKTTDNNIIVHGKHEERKDRYSTVSREFRRRVTIPRGVNPEQVTSTMSPDGVLTIMAPKMMVEGSNERVIPITMGSSGRLSNPPVAAQ